MRDLYPDVVETDRLRLVTARPDTIDTYEAYDLCSRSFMDEVTRFMPWDRHRTPKETREFLGRCATKRDDAESAQFGVFPREGEDGAGELAGFGGLHTKWDRRVGVLGLWLQPRFWGRGYSGERARALVAMAFDVLDLDLVEVKHAVGNENSRRAIEKYVDTLGGRRDGRDRNSLPTSEGIADQYVYSVSREEWTEATGGDYDAEFHWDASDGR